MKFWCRLWRNRSELHWELFMLTVFLTASAVWIYLGNHKLAVAVYAAGAFTKVLFRTSTVFTSKAGDLFNEMPFSFMLAAAIANQTIIGAIIAYLMSFIAQWATAHAIDEIVKD